MRTKATAMSSPDKSVIEGARRAALYAAISNARNQQDSSLRARFDALVPNPELQAEIKGLADAAAEAAMRVLLTELREKRQHAPGEQFGHLVSVVPVSVVDELLAELDRDEPAGVRLSPASDGSDYLTP
jgi:hypothetical protein